MDEVNQRFPLTKYKTWRATREKEGLPTAGGITSPPSRPASIKGIGDETGPSSRNPSRDDRSSLSRSALPNPQLSPTRTVQPPEPINVAPANEPSYDIIISEKMKEPTTQTTALRKASATGDEDEDDDPIRHAAPPELLATPGDTCAICLDTLEDDDDVRGLTCGHAFHAACVDPWLTGRRACCPLCKADYYIPKPRPEGEQTQESQAGGRRSGGMAGLRLNLPQSPQNTWLGGRYASRSRMILLAGSTDEGLDRRLSQTHRSTSLPSSTTHTQQSQQQQTSGWRSRFTQFGRTRSVNDSDANSQSGEQQQQESHRRSRFRPSLRPFARFSGRGTNTSSGPSPSRMEEGVVR